MTTATLVRWILCNGRAAIACAVEINPDRSFNVRIETGSTPSTELVERYPSAVDAMARHASLARSLRESGWFVAARSRVAAPAPAPAAA
jgi:hypothetical protein